MATDNKLVAIYPFGLFPEQYAVIYKNPNSFDISEYDKILRNPQEGWLYIVHRNFSVSKQSRRPAREDGLRFQQSSNAPSVKILKNGEKLVTWHLSLREEENGDNDSRLIRREIWVVPKEFQIGDPLPQKTIFHYLNPEQPPPKPSRFVVLSSETNAPIDSFTQLDAFPKRPLSPFAQPLQSPSSRNKVDEQENRFKNKENKQSYEDSQKELEILENQQFRSKRNRQSDINTTSENQILQNTSKPIKSHKKSKSIKNQDKDVPKNDSINNERDELKQSDAFISPGSSVKISMINEQNLFDSTLVTNVPSHVINLAYEEQEINQTQVQQQQQQQQQQHPSYSISNWNQGDHTVHRRDTISEFHPTFYMQPQIHIRPPTDPSFINSFQYQPRAYHPQELYHFSRPIQEPIIFQHHSLPSSSFPQGDHISPYTSQNIQFMNTIPELPNYMQKKVFIEKNMTGMHSKHNPTRENQPKK